MNNYSSQLNLRGKDSCPHALRGKSYEDVDYCDIDDKLCELEGGNTCDTWNKIQEEYDDTGN